MPKKTRPITVLTEEELNALDDATFDELAADEERLNLALQDPPAVIWSQWATLTLWRGANSILPLQPLERLPNNLATPMDLQRRLPKPPGQKWRLAPSS